jgi:putative flippase GtrA
MTPSPVPEPEILLTGRSPVSERPRGHVLEWIEPSESTIDVGRLRAYARAHASQLVRYVLVGAALALLNLAFLYAARDWMHLPDALAVTAMYVFGVLIHFPSHRWLTYSAQNRPVYPQLARYSVMLIWNFAVMQTIVALASRVSISPYLAVMASTGLTMISNFLAMAHLVFAKRRRR